MSKPSARPWRSEVEEQTRYDSLTGKPEIQRYFWIKSADGQLIPGTYCDRSGGAELVAQMSDDHQYIVKCVNMHDDLIAAIRLILEVSDCMPWAGRLQQLLERAGSPADE